VTFRGQSRKLNVIDYTRNDLMCSHSTSFQSQAKLSPMGVATSVMSEMIGPEVTGESAA